MAVYLKDTIKPNEGANWKVVEPIDIDWKNQEDTSWVQDLKDQLNISSENLEFNNILTKNQIESTLQTTIDEYQFEYDLVWTKYDNDKILYEESTITDCFDLFEKYNKGYQAIFEHFKTKLNTDKTQLNLDKIEEVKYCYEHTEIVNNEAQKSYTILSQGNQGYLKVFTKNSENLNIYKKLNDITDIYRKSRIDLEKEISKYSWTSIKTIKDEQDKFEVEITNIGEAINKGKTTSGGVSITGTQSLLTAKYNLFNEYKKPAFYTNEGYLVPRANSSYANAEQYTANETCYTYSWVTGDHKHKNPETGQYEEDPIRWIEFDHYQENYNPEANPYIKEVGQDSAYLDNKIPVVGEIDLGLKVVWDGNANKWITKAVITADMLEAVLGSVNIKVGNTDKNLDDYLNTLSTKSELQTALSNLNIDDKIKSLNDVNNAYQEYENIKKEYDTLAKKLYNTYTVQGSTRDPLLSDYSISSKYNIYEEYYKLYKKILEIWLYGGKHKIIKSDDIGTFHFIYTDSKQVNHDKTISFNSITNIEPENFNEINQNLFKEDNVFIKYQQNNDIDTYSFRYIVDISYYENSEQNSIPTDSINTWFSLDGLTQLLQEELDDDSLTGIIENYYNSKVELELAINSKIYTTALNAEINNNKIQLLLDKYENGQYLASNGLYIDNDEAGLHIFYRVLRGDSDGQGGFIVHNDKVFAKECGVGGQLKTTNDGKIVYIENGQYKDKDGNTVSSRDEAADVIKDSTIKIKATLEDGEIKTSIVLDSNSIEVDADVVQAIVNDMRIRADHIDGLADLQFFTSQEFKNKINTQIESYLDTNNSNIPTNDEVNNLITVESITKELDEFVKFYDNKQEYCDKSIKLHGYPEILVYNGTESTGQGDNANKLEDISLTLQEDKTFRYWRNEYVKTALIYRYIIKNDSTKPAEQDGVYGRLNLTWDNNDNGYWFKIKLKESPNHYALYLITDNNDNQQTGIYYTMKWSDAKTAYEKRYKRMQVIAKLLKLYIEKFEYIDYINNILKISGNYVTELKNKIDNLISITDPKESKILDVIRQFYKYIIINEFNSTFFDYKDDDESRSVYLNSNWNPYYYTDLICFGNIIDNSTTPYKIKDYALTNSLSKLSGDLNTVILKFNTSDQGDYTSGAKNSYNEYLDAKRLLDDKIDQFETIRGGVIIATDNFIGTLNSSITALAENQADKFNGLSGSVQDEITNQRTSIENMLGDYYTKNTDLDKYYLKTDITKAGEVYSTSSEAGLKVIFDLGTRAYDYKGDPLTNPVTGEPISEEYNKEAHLKVKLKQAKYKHSYDNGQTYQQVYWKHNPFEFDIYNNFIININLTQNIESGVIESYGTANDFSTKETDWPVYAWNIDTNNIKTYKIPPLPDYGQYPPNDKEDNRYKEALDIYYKWKDQHAIFTDETAVDIDADELQAKVKDIKIDAENLVGEIKNVKINSESIDLTGFTTVNDGFSVDDEGSITMKNATISGFIKNEIGVLGYFNQDQYLLGEYNETYTINNEERTRHWSVYDGELLGSNVFIIPNDECALSLEERLYNYLNGSQASEIQSNIMIIYPQNYIDYGRTSEYDTFRPEKCFDYFNQDVYIWGFQDDNYEVVISNIDDGSSPLFEIDNGVRINRLRKYKLKPFNGENTSGFEWERESQIDFSAEGFALLSKKPYWDRLFKNQYIPEVSPSSIFISDLEKQNANKCVKRLYEHNYYSKFPEYFIYYSNGQLLNSRVVNKIVRAWSLIKNNYQQARTKLGEILQSNDTRIETLFGYSVNITSAGIEEQQEYFDYLYNSLNTIVNTLKEYSSNRNTTFIPLSLILLKSNLFDNSYKVIQHSLSGDSTIIDDEITVDDLWKMSFGKDYIINDYVLNGDLTLQVTLGNLNSGKNINCYVSSDNNSLMYLDRQEHVTGDQQIDSYNTEFRTIELDKGDITYEDFVFSFYVPFYYMYYVALNYKI